MNEVHFYFLMQMAKQNVILFGKLESYSGRDGNDVVYIGMLCLCLGGL